MEELTLKEYIKTREFDYFQKEIAFHNEEFKDYQYDLEMFEDSYCLKDVFLFQKMFYEQVGVYILFPIVGKFIHSKATECDCSWCWNSKTYITEEIIKEFEVYLFNLIQNYERE